MVSTTSSTGNVYDLGPGASRMGPSTSSDTSMDQFRLKSNLWRPSQRLCYEARKFEIEKVLSRLKVGSFQTPFNLNIELTGVLNADQQKHLAVKFVLDTANEGLEVRGVTPCRIGFALRKGYSQGKNNSILPFDFDCFNLMVGNMRELFTTASELLSREAVFQNAAEAGLPIHRVVKESISSLIVLSLKAIDTPQNNDAGEKEAVLVMSIQEYYDDKLNNCFQPSSRGVTMALNACYMLMFPSVQAISTIHDALISFKSFMSQHEIKIRKDLLALEPYFDNWESADVNALEEYEAGVIENETGEKDSKLNDNEDDEEEMLNVDE